MKQPDPEELANAWLSQYGAAAAWHARARVARLARFGDDQGAALWSRVL